LQFNNEQRRYVVIRDVHYTCTSVCKKTDSTSIEKHRNKKYTAIVIRFVQTIIQQNIECIDCSLQRIIYDVT